MSKYRIRYFSSFCSSQTCKEHAELVYETHKLENYGIDKEIYITADNNFTHAIIINTGVNNILQIKKENTIGLAFEPCNYLGLTTNFILYVRENISKYYIGSDSNILGEPFIERFGFIWHTPPLLCPPIKQNATQMSIMVSQKKEAPGHKYRHVLAQKILEQNLPIHIFGRGCHEYVMPPPPQQQALPFVFNLQRRNINSANSLPKTTTINQNIKGEFAEKEPYETYNFHIAIENFQTPHYFSEKIINTLLCETTPIYLGCTNIDHYFPNMVVAMCGQADQDIELIKQILRNPAEYKKVIDVDAVKRQTNLLLNLDKIFGETIEM